MTAPSRAPVSELNSVRWRKSRHSTPEGNCVELAAMPSGRVAIRDSHQPAGPTLTLTSEDWHAFTRCIKDGAFDEL